MGWRHSYVSPDTGLFSRHYRRASRQAFSRLRYFVEYNGYKTAPNLIPEFERCIGEAQPVWFLMENVPKAPIPDVQGYSVHSQVVNNRWYCGVQNRTRRISFGTRNGVELPIPRQKELAEYAPAVCASGWVKDGDKGNYDAKKLGYTSRKILKKIQELQGLPDDFELSTFTVEGATKVIGNGVPLPMGRAIARAVREVIRSEQF